MDSRDRLQTFPSRPDKGIPRPHRWKPLMPRVKERSRINPDTGCWEWIGNQHPQGYGLIWFQGRPWVAHRAVYTELVGPIGEGLELDHLCENKCCVNPEHMEPVTHYTNSVRSRRGFQANAHKTHCKHGHEFSAENTRMVKQSGGRSGWRRECKECQRINQRKWYRAKKEAANV